MFDYGISMNDQIDFASVKSCKCSANWITFFPKRRRSDNGAGSPTNAQLFRELTVFLLSMDGLTATIFIVCLFPTSR